MNVEVQRAAKSLDERNRSGARLVLPEPRFGAQVRRDGPDHDAERAVHGVRVAGEQETHGKGNAKHPLANAAPGQDIVHEQRRGVDHAPGAAARAKPAMLATECNESFGLTVHAAHAQESVVASGR